MAPRPSDRNQLRVARVYDEPSGDGYRVLVDRLWPRGVAKDHLELDEWAKDVAPSTELRRWYGHDPERFDEFARRYQHELEHAPGAEVAVRLAATAGTKTLVLLTATRDVDRSGATVLADHLRAMTTKTKTTATKMTKTVAHPRTGTPSPTNS